MKVLSSILYNIIRTVLMEVLQMGRNKLDNKSNVDQLETTDRKEHLDMQNDQKTMEVGAIGTDRLKNETKSAWFKRLFDGGMSVSEITKTTGAHYSFVYGVVSNYKPEEHAARTNKRDGSKSAEFRKMWDTGMTVGEIAKETNSNYSFVHSVIKKHRNQQDNQ